MRSGSHAVLNWLVSLFPAEDVALIHNITKDKYFSFNKKASTLVIHKENNLDLFSNLKNEDFTTNLPEDIRKDLVDFAASPRFFVLNIRHPLNQLASIWKANKIRGIKNPLSKQFRRITKSHMQEALRETEKLERPTICLFDRFISSEQYRKNLCVKIGGTYSDNSLEKVAEVWLGSSFENKKLSDNSYKKRVTERWKHIPTDALKTILEWDDVMDLSDKIFGRDLRDKAQQYLIGKK